MSTSARRLPHVDALKAIAAQAIVLHHLLSYGPIARAAHAALPMLAGAAHQYGRLAVQVFLVMGGFLSARGLSPRGQALAGSALPLLWRRYLRLMLPFMAAVALTLLVSTVIEPQLPELAPQSPISLGQLLAHATLTHELLGFEALTVGAWYVAIDLQLFALLLALMWLTRRVLAHPSRLVAAPLAVGALVLASAWVFNRNAALDATGLYFFAAYGLGACVHWLGLWRHRRLGLSLLALGVLAALALDWRGRLALALATSLILAWAQERHRSGGQVVPGGGAAFAMGAKHSYSLFLLHFPVLLLANGLVAAIEPGPVLTLAALPATWWLANRLAVPFHRFIEVPSVRLDPLAGLPGWGAQAARS